MKWRDLIRHLENYGCEFLREDGNHTIYGDRRCEVRIDTRLRSALSNHRHHRPGWKGDSCLETPQRPTMSTAEKEEWMEPNWDEAT
jgi:hypothetical protein